jgi:hypothetical protein
MPTIGCSVVSDNGVVEIRHRSQRRAGDVEVEANADVCRTASPREVFATPSPLA